MTAQIFPAYLLPPRWRTDITVGTYPTYVTLYDSGSPTTTGGGLPARAAYITARVTSPKAVVTAGTLTDAAIIEIVHLLDTTTIAVEQFGIVCGASAADADGADLRTIASGYEVFPRGNRIIVRSAGSVAEMTIDFAIHWGRPDLPRVTEVGGAFSYDATGGNIAAATFWLRAGILRPMKSCAITFTIDTGFTGTAFQPSVRGLVVDRTTNTASVLTSIAGAALVANVAQSLVIAGVGADTTFDQNIVLDAIEVFNGAQLNQAGVDAGRVRWKMTTTHI